jgi:teichuronic acid biosynthesis glycosyltransferase TuaC
MTRRLHVLAFTSLFRTPHETVRAPFTTEFLRALQEFARVTLVCPIPWAPDIGVMRRNPTWRNYIDVPDVAQVDGITVHYIRYPIVPKVSSLLQPMLQALAAYRRVAGIHRQEPVDVVNGRFVYPDGVAATWLARRIGASAVLTALGTDINVYAQQPIKRQQTQWAVRHADHVTAVSPALGELICELGASPDRVSAAVNGIDLGKFMPDGPRMELPNLGTQANGYLLCVARLSLEKGLHVLVESLGALKRLGGLDFHTVLVGDGPQRSSLEQRVAALGLSKEIVFAGEADHRDIPRWLRGARALCLPSFREGTPNVVLEALACGVPVISTNVGGTPLVINAANGLLVEPDDASGLAHALQSVMHGQWDRKQIRASVEHLSWRSEAQRHVELFQRLLQARPQEAIA